MEDLLIRISRIPKNFLHDFYNLTKRHYGDSEKFINFDLVIKWLKVRKDHLKRLLIKHFTEHYDYEITEVKVKNKNRGSNYKENIMLTSDCFKELCMLSQTEMAKEVRKYYLELEKIIIRHYEDIRVSLEKKIGILENNQKPKCSVKGGVIYVIEASNNLTPQNLRKTLLKLGKSNDIKKRLATYNTGTADEIKILFMLSVRDIDKVEACIKNLVKEYQYRKYKEVYQIDITILKEAAFICNEVMEGFREKIENIDGYKEVNKGTKKINRSVKNNKNYFIRFKNNSCE